MKTFKKLFAYSAIFALLATMMPTYANAASYDAELTEAYAYAKNKWITTMTSIDNADMYGNLTRVAMAKMVANYVLDLGLQELDTDKECNFPDVSASLDEAYDNGVTKACQLGLMGVGIEKFNPNGIVTRAEFGTVLSRALWGDEYNGADPYYKDHLQALKDEGIMNIIDNPNMKEVRGYVMLMMMRADDAYTPTTGCSAEELLACILAEDYQACIATCSEDAEEEVAGDGFVTVSKWVIPADQTVAKNAIEANLWSIKLTAGDHDTTISSIEITKSGLGEEKDITDLQIMYKWDYVSNPGKVKNSKATIRFTPAITIKAKSSMTFDIVANLSGEAGNNFGFSVTDVVVANWKSTGTPVKLGNITTANYSVKSITTDMDTPTAKLKAWDSKKTILTINLDNNSTSDTNVTDMVVSASNATNPREVDLDETFANIKAYVDDKEVWKVTINEESFVLSNLNIDINRADDIDVVLKWDVTYVWQYKTLTFELSSNRVTATEKINWERMWSSVSTGDVNVEWVDLKVEANWKGEDPQKVSVEDGKVTLLDLMVKADSSTEITQFYFNLNGVDLTNFVDQELTLSVWGYEYSLSTGDDTDIEVANTTGLVVLSGKNDSFYAPARILVTAKLDKNNATAWTIDKMNFGVSGVIINDILVPVTMTSTKLLWHKTTIEDGSVKLAKRTVNDENTLKWGKEHEVLFFDLTAWAQKQTLQNLVIDFDWSETLDKIADSARLIAEVDWEETEVISWDSDSLSWVEKLQKTWTLDFEEISLERDSTVKFTLLVDLKDEVSVLWNTWVFSINANSWSIILKDTWTNIKWSDVKWREYTVADVTPTVDRNLTAWEDYVEFTLSNDSEYDVILSGKVVLSMRQKASQNATWEWTWTLLDANWDELAANFAKAIPWTLEFDFTQITDVADRTISSKWEITYRVEIKANRFSIDELSIILKSIQFVYDDDGTPSAQITKKW